MTINLNRFQERIDLAFTVMNKKRYQRWYKGYKKGKRCNSKLAYLKMSKRLQRHKNKPKIRKKLFKK